MTVEGQLDNPSQKFKGESITLLTIQPHTTACGVLAGWFEESTGASIRVVPVSYDKITEIGIDDVRSGLGNYDVIQYWYPMLGSMVEEGILQDITDWWDQYCLEINPEDFIPVFSNTWCIKNNRRFGVPFDGDMHLLFYNTALFEKFEQKPPKTWDEYLQISKVITTGGKDDGIFGCGIMAAKIPLILIGTYLNRLASFGGNFFDDKGKPSINSPEALAALEHLLKEMPFAVPNSTEMAFDEMLAPWLAGKVGMVEFWGDLGKITDNPEQSTIAHQWGVVPLPKGPGIGGQIVAPLNAGWSLGVSSNSRKRELALEFLKFTLDPEIQLRICTIKGGLDPVRWSTYDLPTYKSFVTPELALAARVAVESAPVAWPSMAAWPTLQAVLNNNLYLALTHQITPSEALNLTQAAWAKLV